MPTRKYTKQYKINAHDYIHQLTTERPNLRLALAHIRHYRYTGRNAYKVLIPTNLGAFNITRQIHIACGIQTTRDGEALIVSSPGSIISNLAYLLNIPIINYDVF